MNQTNNSTRLARIVKIQKELIELKARQKAITHDLEPNNLAQIGREWWELDAQIKADELMLKNLTSLCVYCQQDGAELDLNEFIDLVPFKDLTDKKAHRDCFKKRWGM